MLRLFIHKEIYQNLANRIFWLMCLIVFIFNIYCTIEQIITYNNEKEVFDEFWIEHQRFNHLRPEELQSAVFNMAILPPANLGMMFPEIEQFVGVSAIDQNSLTHLFKGLDFCMFTGIIFSLLALILAFHTIVGEREDGTLKLVSSYPVKRTKIIIAKWIGIVFVISILYTLCFITTVLLVNIFANTIIGSIEISSLMLIYFFGLIYISGIVLLGIYISIKVKYSYLSLLVSLLVWGVIVLVMPSLPAYIGQLVKVPSSLQILYNELDINSRKITEVQKVKEKYAEQGIDLNSSKVEEEINKVRSNIQQEGAFMNKKFETGSLKRLSLSMGVSIFSPYVCYTLAANEAAATGISVNALLLKQREEYRSRLNSFLDKVNQKKRQDSEYIANYDDIPRFNFTKPNLVVRIGASALPIMLLTIFNIVFLVSSYRAFRRYDVR